jgi:ribosomal protein S16
LYFILIAYSARIPKFKLNPMKIFLHYVKSKPFKVAYILAGDSAKPKSKTNNKIGTYLPKSEGKPEKLDLDIKQYDDLFVSGAKVTKTVEKLRMTIEPPPPPAPGSVTEASAEDESPESAPAEEVTEG